MGNYYFGMKCEENLMQNWVKYLRLVCSASRRRGTVARTAATSTLT